MKEIDLNTWELKEQYELFSKCEMPFYGITTKIDITNVYNFAKKNKISFYFCMGHVVQTALKQIDEFNIRIENEKLVLDDRNLVSFVCKNANERAYRYVDVPYKTNIIEFCKLAEKINLSQTRLFGDGKYGQNYAVYISCAPWMQFTQISNPRSNDIDDLIPKIVWDKYQEENGRKFLNVGVEVNHRVIDGYAIGQLVCKINEVINNLL